MYKTIRHGENSLQYTILPQNDDFRLDGKLTSASTSSSSTSNNIAGNKLLTKRTRKRSFFAYLGLIFVCTVIIGAILIPFLVSAECLPSPSDWFLKAKVAFTKHDIINNINGNNNNNNNNNKKNSNKNNKIGSTIKSYLDSNKRHHSHHKNTEQIQENLNNNDGTTNVPVSVSLSDITSIKNDLNSNNLITTSLSSLEAINNNNNYDDLQQYTSGRPISKNIRKKVLNPDHYNILPTDENLIDDNTENDIQTSYINYVPNTEKIIDEKKTTIATKIMTTKIKRIRTTTFAPIETSAQPLLTSSLSSSSVVASNDNNKKTTEKSLIKNSQSITDNYGSTTDSGSLSSSLQIIKISTKKPIILPVLAKTNSVIRENGKFIDDDDDNNNIENKNNWIRQHWPFIDPSTYFQWAGVKSEDSVLLPAILGLALVGLILIIALCLVVRHKNKIVSSVRNRNRNITSEEAGEDNTTLLTTGNTSDDD